MQVGALFAKLSLDPSDFESGLSKAKNLGNQAAQDTQGAFSRMGSFVQNSLSTAAGFLMANVFGKVLDGVKSLAGGMISGNAEFERYQTQFGVLLKSAPAAQERLAELAKFGATTPFELPELVRADKVLTAFGLHSEDTQKRFGVSGSQILKTIGDISAGTGANFEELSVTFGKFASGATGEAISRFQELGIATREQMAQWGLQFSKSGQLLTPTAQAFTILEKHVRDKFGGMMDAQSATFEGMVSNLQDWAGQTMRTMGAPIFDALKDKLAALLAFLGDPATQATLNSLAQSLAQGVGTAVDWLSNVAFPALQQAWTNLQPSIQAARDLFDSLSLGVSNLLRVADVNGFMALFTVFEDGTSAVSSFMERLGMSEGTALQVSEALRVLSETVAGLVVWVRDTLVPVIQANLQPIMAGLAAVLVAVVVPAFIAWADVAAASAVATVTALAPVIIPLVAIGAAVALLYKVWTEDWGGIRTTLTTWWEGTGQPIFNTLRDWLATHLTAALQTLSDFWTGTLQPALAAVWGFISKVLIPILSVLVQAHIAVLSTAVRLLGEIWSNVLWPALKKVGDWIDAHIMPTLRTLEGQGLKLVQAAAEGLATFWTGTLHPALTRVGNYLADTLGPTLGMVKNSFGHISDAVGWVTQKLQDFKGWLDSIHIPDWLQGHSPPPLAHWFSYIADAAGQANGVVNGFADMLNGAASAANGLVGVMGQLDGLAGISVKVNTPAAMLAGGLGSVHSATAVNIGSVTQNNAYNPGSHGRSLADEISGIQGLSGRL
jgi:uncharacterized membrane protein